MHDLASKNKWTPGIDYPEWGDNELYLSSMINGFCKNQDTPRDIYYRLAVTASKYCPIPAINADHFFEVLWKGWLIPSTPVMYNFGSNRGLPISCFAGRVPDTMIGIAEKESELRMLSKLGGGTTYDFSLVRPIGSEIKKGKLGRTDGIIPFIKCHDSIIHSSKQGDMRRGAEAVYLDINHKEYESFLTIREPKGDINRQCHNLHQGSIITDQFMHQVRTQDGDERVLWKKTIKQRVKTGEPYIFYKDNANKVIPEWWPKHLTIHHSNLCSEIMLPTDEDHTLVCCLSSLNASKYYEWKDTSAVQISTIFLDCVIQEFIEKADGVYGIQHAVDFAVKSRALGLGVVGWHTLLQQNLIPFIGIQANSLTQLLFKHIQQQSDQASILLRQYNTNPPEWCINGPYNNLTKITIAPNRSSSKVAGMGAMSDGTLIQGQLSQGIEPLAANYYVDEDSKGTYIRKNPILQYILGQLGKDNLDTWNQIERDNGSVAGLDIDDYLKNVFKTFKEIDQTQLVRQAALRQKYIDQGQSINLAFTKDAPANYINQTHLLAHELGVKSLYYLRSESPLRADQRVEQSQCVSCEG